MPGPATYTEGKQGRSYRMELAADEVATVTFGALETDWQGAVSWVAHPAQDVDGEYIGEVAVEYSLHPEGDDWSPELDSPFKEKTQGVETSPLERMRFTEQEREGTADTEAIIEFLTRVPISIEIA